MRKSFTKFLLVMTCFSFFAPILMEAKENGLVKVKHEKKKKKKSSCGC